VCSVVNNQTTVTLR